MVCTDEGDVAGEACRDSPETDRNGDVSSVNVLSKTPPLPFHDISAIISVGTPHGKVLTSILRGPDLYETLSNKGIFVVANE